MADVCVPHRLGIYPAHAGINPPWFVTGRPVTHLPRTRGDKPYAGQKQASAEIIYPAHAGINRSLMPIDLLNQDLPRTRGDKPETGISIPWWG